MVILILQGDHVYADSMLVVHVTTAYTSKDEVNSAVHLPATQVHTDILHVVHFTAASGISMNLTFVQPPQKLTAQSFPQTRSLATLTAV